MKDRYVDVFKQLKSGVWKWVELKIYLPCCPVVLEAAPKTDEVVDEPNREAVFCCCCPPEAPPNIEGFRPWACWPKTKLNEYDFASSLLFFSLFTH